MFPFSKRPDAAPSFHMSGELPPAIEWGGVTLSSPYELITASEATLNQSTEAWRYVAQRAEHVRSEDTAAALETGISEALAKYPTTFQPGAVGQEARRLNDAFSIHALLVARYLSGQAEPEEALQDPRHAHGFLAVEDPNVRRLMGRKNFPGKALVDKPVNDMFRAMEFADKAAQVVLEALARGYEDDPEGIIALAELYKGDVTDADSRFRELREIVSADWHHPNKRQSVLRQYCDRVFQDPERYVSEFAEQIAESPDSKRLLAVKRMAQFAVAAARQQGVELSVEDTLTSTYDQWDEFEEIESLFTSFIRQKKESLEEAFFTIAGVRNAKSIRLPRTLQDIESSRTNLRIHLGNRWMRRNMGGDKRPRTAKVNGNLPDAEAISQAATQETKKEPLPLMVAKRASDGITHVSRIALDEVVDVFSVGDGNGRLQEDVRRMIAHLQDNPISHAAVILKGRTMTLQEESGRTTKIPLRRFAPEDSPGLTVSGENRYHRIVFALANRALVLVKIQSHEDYNKGN
jgi:hypothetical protein